MRIFKIFNKILWGFKIFSIIKNYKFISSDLCINEILINKYKWKRKAHDKIKFLIFKPHDEFMCTDIQFNDLNKIIV